MSPVEQFDIDDPENYILTFTKEGALIIKADCNNAMGDYTSDVNSLNITVGPMTKAACPPGSRGEQFTRLLGGAALYFIEDGNLYIDLMADGGTFTFAPIEEPTVVDQQNPNANPALIANPWSWVTFTNPAEQLSLENPQDYLLIFNEDGSLNIKADCNNAIGNYSLDESKITIDIGPITMAACLPGSRSDRFVNYLGFAANYFFQDGQLFIDLFADGGTLEFAPIE